MQAISQAEVKAAILASIELGRAIRDLGSVTAGRLYTEVMAVMTHEYFERAIKFLVDQGMIRRDRDHLLTWIAG